MELMCMIFMFFLCGGGVVVVVFKWCGRECD